MLDILLFVPLLFVLAIIGSIILAFFKREKLQEVTNCRKEKACEKCEDCSKSKIVNYNESVLEYQGGLLKIELDENDKKFKFNGKTLVMKVIDNSDEHSGLYFNGKIVDSNYGHYVLYITEKFILVSWPRTTCGELIVGYIDENSNYHSEELTGLYSHNDEEGNMTFAIYKENGKIVGDAPVNGKLELCEHSKKIEFVYDKGKLTIKDVK